jgi:hypothetical protein
VERLASVATQNLRDVVDHAFWRGVALIAVLALSTLVAALTYRYAAARMPTTYARARAAL